VEYVFRYNKQVSPFIRKVRVPSSVEILNYTFDIPIVEGRGWISDIGETIISLCGRFETSLPPLVK